MHREQSTNEQLPQSEPKACDVEVSSRQFDIPDMCKPIDRSANQMGTLGILTDLFTELTSDDDIAGRHRIDGNEELSDCLEEWFEPNGPPKTDALDSFGH